MKISTMHSLGTAILLAIGSGSVMGEKGVAYDAAGSAWRNGAGECWTTDFRDADAAASGCFAEPRTQAVSDSDGDGVADAQDRCPDTPAGVVVDEQGCIPDSDGDGVADNLDECPDTASGAQVDALGCEPDSDGDGVVDARDQCPGTPAGSSVDQRGCALKIVLNRIPFEVDSDRIDNNTAAELSQVAAALKSRKDIESLQVIGHTDALGSMQYNQTLSEKRARAVAQFLVSQGVPAEIIQVSGAGETAPVADNATAQGREQNRRVELKVN
ncbi:MAG: OmpA family protein [Candidatus Thiodiazotropha sp.]